MQGWGQQSCINRGVWRHISVQSKSLLCWAGFWLCTTRKVVIATICSCQARRQINQVSSTGDLLSSPRRRVREGELGLRRNRSVQPQWRKGSTSNHRTQQNQGSFTLFSHWSGHVSRGEWRRVCSSPQKHLRQRNIINYLPNQTGRLRMEWETPKN